MGPEHASWCREQSHGTKKHRNYYTLMVQYYVFALIKTTSKSEKHYVN